MKNRPNLYSRLDWGLEDEQKLKNNIYEDLHVKDVWKYMKQSFLPQQEKDDLQPEITVKVDELVYKRLYDMFNLAKSRLHYSEPLELYIKNTSEINAFACTFISDDKVNRVILTSSLVNSFSDDQLMYVIGHEIGHIMNKDGELDEVEKVLFPGKNCYPEELKIKNLYLGQLREIKADRCGCIACENLEAAVSAFLVFNGGIMHDRFPFDEKSYLARCRENVEYIEKFKGDFNADEHPEDPLRVRLMDLFFNAKNKQELVEETHKVLSILHKVNVSESSKKFLIFYATAGLMIASIDGHVSEAEKKAVLKKLMEYHMFPQDIMDIIQKGNVEQMFYVSINLINQNPEPFSNDAYNAVKYMLKVAIMDQCINEKELDFIKGIAMEQFGISEQLFAHIYVEAMKAYFNPYHTIIKKTKKNA